MTHALVRRRPLVLPLGTPPLISLNAVTANGTGTAFNLGHAFSNWEVQVTTTGSPGGFSVQLQGCLDGATFVNIGSPITTVGLTNVTANTPLASVQLVLSGLTGGTNPTVTATVGATEAPAGAGGGGGGAVTQSTGAGAAAPWSVELSDGAAFYVGAKDTTLTTTNTEIGSLTETVPATDTASSGLNGRLQRLAQRITSLIALLPAALVNGALVFTGDTAHGATDAGNPVEIGFGAVAHGANPTAVTAGQRTRGYANRAGVPFVIGGHPNIQTIRVNYTTAQTDTAIITVAAGMKIVVTGLLVTVDAACTVNTAVRLGFGTANTPTAAGVVGSHPGVAPGSGFGRGGGAGIIGVGADDADLRITSGVPTGGSIDVDVSYFTVES